MPHPAPIIEGFQLHEEIGVGGYSRVYRALQLSIERDVAIKVLNQPFETDDERAAFRQECRVMGRLNHPNVVRVHDSATTADGRGCIIMELYPSTYRGAGPLGADELVDVGHKLAAALAEAHDADIVHHDIKPQNVFRSVRGEPALGDFGISSIGGRRAGRTRLTIRYAPPEMLRDGRSDALGDIYSLGVCLFELATGRPPFDADNDAELIRRVVSADAPSLGRSDVPYEFHRVISACLAKEPAERPRSARAIADDLGRTRRHAAPDPPPVTSRSAGDESAPNRTVDAATLGRAAAAPAHPSATSYPASDAPEPATGNRRVLFGAVAVVAAVIIAVALAIRGFDDDRPVASSSPPSSVAGPSEPPMMLVSPPGELRVRRVDNGFRFSWSPAVAGDGVQLIRQGTDDSVIAEDPPYLWTLEASADGDCFVARGTRDGRMSTRLTEPVCITG